MHSKQQQHNDFCRVDFFHLSLSLSYFVSFCCCCSSCARLIFETMSCFMFIIRTTSHIIWTRETWYLQCAMHVKDTLNMFVYNQLMADNLWLFIHKINIAGRVSVKCIHTHTRLWSWLAGWLARCRGSPPTVHKDGWPCRWFIGYATDSELLLFHRVFRL